MAWTLHVNAVPHALPHSPALGRYWVSTVKGGPRQIGEMTIKEQCRHDLGTLSARDHVRLKRGSRTLFDGWIRKIHHQGDPGGELVTYTCIGVLSALARIYWEDDGQYRVCFNVSDDSSPDYDADFDEIGISGMLSSLLTAIDSNLTGKAYIDAWDVDDGIPAVTPDDLVFSAPTGAKEIIDSLLRWAPGWLPWLQYDGAENPTFHKLWISDILDLPVKTITIGGNNWVQSNDLMEDLSEAFTAIQLSGQPEATDVLYWYDPDDNDCPLVPDWNSSDEDGWNPANRTDDQNKEAVFTRFKERPLYSADKWSKSDVRCTPSTTVKAWAESYFYAGGETPATIILSKGIDEWNNKSKAFSLTYPAYLKDPITGAYSAAKVWVRLQVTGEATSLRVPETGYSGEAYDQYGIEDEYVRYVESLAKTTMTGTATADSTDGVLYDGFAGVRSFNLAGCILTVNSVEYTIVNNGASWFELECDNEEGTPIPPPPNISEGDAYSIACVDTSAQYTAIATAILPGLSAAPKPLALTRKGVDRTIDDGVIPDACRISLAAGDGHTTGWEALGLVLTGWTIDFDRDSVTIEADSPGALAAKNLEDMEAELDIKSRLEEVEIWQQRHDTSNVVAPSADPIPPETTYSMAMHDHSDFDNGGPLNPYYTRWKWGDDEGPLAMEWVEEDECWVARPAAHHHGSDADGGYLWIDGTMWAPDWNEDEEFTGHIRMVWEGGSDRPGWYAAWNDNDPLT